MRLSLEEERRALLEEIDARRSLYRRMLNGESDDHQTTATRRQTSGQAMSPRNNQLRQWLLNHPLQVATGVALLVWLGPRLIRRNQARPKTVAQMPKAGRRTDIMKAIAGMLMLLRSDPRQLKTTASMVGNAWRWLRHATNDQTHTHGRKPYA